MLWNNYLIKFIFHFINNYKYFETEFYLKKCLIFTILFYVMIFIKVKIEFLKHFHTT